MIGVGMESDYKICRGFNSWFKTAFQFKSFHEKSRSWFFVFVCFAWNRKKEEESKKKKKKKTARTILGITVVTVNHFIGNNAY